VIVELLTFRPRAGVCDEDLLAAESRACQEFTHLQPGIVRRMTAVSADGEWLVLQLWSDEASADAAAAAAGADPAVAALHALADPASFTTRRYGDIGG
jgi:hypothetical protein